MASLRDILCNLRWASDRCLPSEAIEEILECCAADAERTRRVETALHHFDGWHTDNDTTFVEPEYYDRFAENKGDVEWEFEDVYMERLDRQGLTPQKAVACRFTDRSSRFRLDFIKGIIARGFRFHSIGLGSIQVFLPQQDRIEEPPHKRQKLDL